jgi:hypothetical protein
MAGTPGCRHKTQRPVLLTVREHVAIAHHRLWSSLSPEPATKPRMVPPTWRYLVFVVLVAGSRTERTQEGVRVVVWTASCS